MDNATLDFLKTLAENLSVIAVLLFAWMREAKRADRLEAKLITTMEIEKSKEQ